MQLTHAGKGGRVSFAVRILNREANTTADGAGTQSIFMSTKTSLKYERDEATGQLVHLYQDAFDEEHVCLEIEGFPFEAASSVELSGQGPSRITFRLPNAWARKLGLLEP